MAIEKTGSTSTFSFSNNANTGTVSSTITVPADAEKVIVGVTGYTGTVDGFETMTFTKGAADTAMTKVSGGDASDAAWQGAMFWMDAPDTGSNKSCKWDWIGAGTSADPDLLFVVTFWKGTATGVRDSDGDQGGSTPHVTPTLTAQSGDKIVAFAFAFNNGAEGTVDTWTNLTLLEQIAKSSNADAALATADPSGNQTAGWSAGTNMSEGGIVAAVLTPSAVGPTVQRDFSWHFG